MDLKNKRILITAGPTWVSIDKVRVISNTATGETGILLADKLAELGADVTMILGPVPEAGSFTRGFRLIRYKYFDQLRDSLIREIKKNKYDFLIHSAAVSDYKPVKVCRQKVKSDIKYWKLTLSPTVKIVDLVRKLNRSLFIAGFKFEPDAARKFLLSESQRLMRRSGLDLVVANTFRKERYQAYIIDNKGVVLGPMARKKELVKKLVDFIVSAADRRDLPA